MYAKAKRLIYTLWPLKLRQHWGLFYYRVLRRIVPFKITKAWASKVENWKAEFYRYQPAAWKNEMEFVFLNCAATVQSENWQAEGQNLLWHYNLHYFDHLNAKERNYSAIDEARLIQDWWQHHQSMQGIAWDPYPTSLRAVNFCKWGWAYNRYFELISQEEWLAILDRHFQEVRRKLEYHIQANHLFANLKALWFLQAALPEYRAKEGRWLVEQVLGELRTQFDADGGHFELSPMYHRIMLWDLLDMLAIGRKIPEFKPALTEIERLLPAAVRWMQALSHPDSEVAFFNDACIGIAPKQAELLDYATRLGVVKLKVINGLYSGYGIARLGGATLLCDAAEIGPSFQPGHGHADSLSFELSIGRQRVIVNSGTSEYGTGQERLRQRGTAAHSTICLNGVNSSDVWSGFRVGKQANVISRHLEISEDSFRLMACHNGYAPAVHQRIWNLTDGLLQIDDKLAGSGSKQSYLHFHPEIMVSQLSHSQFLLRWGVNKAILTVECKNSQLELVESSWHPAFNTSKRNYCLVVGFTTDECKIKLKWSE